MTVLLMPRGGAARRRPCPGTTPGARRATRASATRPTHRRSTRSSPSCATVPMTVTAGACERRSSSCGAPGCASMKRSPSPSTTSTTGADRSWSATARAGAAARSGWTSGAGNSCGRGWPRASSFRSGRCSASSMARPAGGRGQAPPSAASSGASRPRRASGAGSRLISCATRTRLSWPARACR
jgi:hypothetical protein